MLHVLRYHPVGRDAPENLLSLQDNAQLMAPTQNRLAPGKTVNSAQQGVLQLLRRISTPRSTRRPGRRI
ncbi:hypothetical protein ACLBXO_25000 [Methylobacterium sp. C33D]